MISPHDRRQAPRFPASYPIESEQWIGTTENLSVSGVYFVAPESTLAAGDVLRFSIVLDDEQSAELVLLQCHGRIIRTDPREGHTTGVAATIDSFWFETWKKKPVMVN